MSCRQCLLALCLVLVTAAGCSAGGLSNDVTSPAHTGSSMSSAISAPPMGVPSPSATGSSVPTFSPESIVVTAQSAHADVFRATVEAPADTTFALGTGSTSLPCTSKGTPLSGDITSYEVSCPRGPSQTLSASIQYGEFAYGFTKHMPSWR